MYNNIKGRPANIGFAKWRLQCFDDSLVQGSISVFQFNICVEKPPLRKAEYRYMALLDKNLASGLGEIWKFLNITSI